MSLYPEMMRFYSFVLPAKSKEISREPTLVVVLASGNESSPRLPDFEWRMEDEWCRATP